MLTADLFSTGCGIGFKINAYWDNGEVILQAKFIDQGIAHAFRLDNDALAVEYEVSLVEEALDKRIAEQGVVLIAPHRHNSK